MTRAVGRSLPGRAKLVRAALDHPIDVPDLHHGSHSHLLSFLDPVPPDLFSALPDTPDLSSALPDTPDLSSTPSDTPDRGGRTMRDTAPGCTVTATEPVERGVDAIVVPTFRPHHALRDSLAVAQELGCRLVALCSGPAEGWRAVELADEFGVDVIAVDLHEVWPALPRFRSDEVLARNGFVHSSDLSLKRNLGLLLGRLIGWRRVLFLDDDITQVKAAELTVAARHLDGGEFRAVGLRNTGFPDNSVVCHAYRAIGAAQDSFIGGGAMIVDPGKTRSFFPNIYNEDWFFLLGDGVPFRAAVSGTMHQRSYDPFAAGGRAIGEELGDTLAEGLFWLLDGGSALESSDAGFWGRFLARRRLLLDHVLNLVDAEVTDPARRESIKESVRAARARSSDINAWLCHSFVEAWRRDLQVWDTFLSERASCYNDPEKALAELGLAHVSLRRAARGISRSA
ncbi:hypothetical protein KOI35_02860 [Actinoplanes bogorensis]|uniref:Glycosyltransferase n=1 Tax=Paractinoplanes bogorensis TaxID=1610840 RepID=A0ABS5YG41_9ACTN|nr:hypothetical protein [Actinoplanes bogorensis]MBU2662443.1 hypothetical protein [Actinoplanes bogorensis]